jgi:hypothetical protein
MNHQSIKGDSAMSETRELNGRVTRKSLADQIDRLDGILDGLSDALNGSVANAVKDAVGQAVHEAVREAVAATLQAVLADPGLKAALAARGPAGSEQVSLTSAPGRSIAAGVREATKRASSHVAAAARGWLGRLMHAVKVALRVRKPLGLAVAVGVAIGLGCFLAGPVAAAAVSGLAGFTASLSASALSAIRRMLASSALPQR